MHPYFSLGRPLTSLMIGLAVLASALIGVGSNVKEYVLPVFLGFTVAFLFGIAGNAINDYLDRETDKINHPDRPIPSGKLKPEQALFFSMVFFALSLLLALFLSFIVKSLLVVVIVVIALVSQIAYEWKFKH
jgi:geranylgeranylglycerol-phosphate geranylgeranyltransferase